MKKPTNGYYVLIKQHSDSAIVKVSGPHHSMRTAEKIERGMNINLAQHLFYTDSAWFGPNPEPSEES